MRVRLKLLQVVGSGVKRSNGKPLGRQALTIIGYVDVRVDDGDVKAEIVIGCKLTSGSKRILGAVLCVVDFRRIKTLALNVVDCSASIHVGGRTANPMKKSSYNLTLSHEWGVKRSNFRRSKQEIETIAFQN
jgi:hypothetical protein